MAITGLTTFLWFDNEAEEAAEFYVSLFPGSRITSVSHYGPGSPKPEGSVLTVAFELFGQSFSALNASPQFPHSEAVSFMVHCDTQDEIDFVWNTIVDSGGQESQCGWCTDRFGVSWQIIPHALGTALSNPDPEKSQKAFAAMMKMTKIVIDDL